MAEITFIYNQNQIMVQCQEKELFKEVITKFSNKIGSIIISDFYFISGGKLIDYNQPINIIFKKELDNKSSIQVLVCSFNERYPQQNCNLSKEIICPKYNEPCIFEIKDYKITFSGCKNGHITKDILLYYYLIIKLIN